MDNNAQEEVMETQENASVEEKENASGKKNGIIIGAVALALVIVMVVIALRSGGGGNGKLEIDGHACSYSAEYGIKGVEKVCDGVVVSGMGSSLFYPASGEPQEVATMDVLDGKYPVAFMGCMRVGDEDLMLTNYNVFGDFKTQFGATSKSTKAELDKKNYVLAGDVYTVVSTDKGVIDWDDIEKDYETIISANSFEGVEYIDSACLVGPDVVKFDAEANRVQEVVKIYDSISNSTAKDEMMRWLAMGKAVHMLSEGQVQYVVVEGVYCKDDGANILYVRMYTSIENANKIRENMGIVE